MIVNEVCIHYYNETLPRKRANARDAAVPSRKKTKQGNADPPENIGGGGLGGWVTCRTPQLLGRDDRAVGGVFVAFEHILVRDFFGCGCFPFPMFARI